MAIGPQVFVAQPFARKTKLHITAPTVVKASAGFIGTVAIVAPPSAAGGVYDSATVGAIAAANQIAEIPASGTSPLALNFSCANGIVVDPGTAGIVSVTFQ